MFNALGDVEIPVDVLINDKPFVLDKARKYTAESLLRSAVISLEGIQAVRQYFCDGIRQRWWPIGWNEIIDSGIELGDKFVVEMGDLIPPPES